MKNIQIILNAVLSKNTFEYILIDKKFKIVSTSEGVVNYVGSMPKNDEDVLNYLPELVGSETEILDIFSNTSLTYILESIHKNEYYINITVEHYDDEVALILLHNITDITLSKQKLLQYSNESLLINSTLQKILDRQNALLFVTNNEEISFANEKFLEYFSVKRIEDLRRKNLSIYTYFDPMLKSYDALFEKVNSKENYIIINDDTFILQATSIESTHKLFTLTKVTELSHEVQIDKLTGIYKKPYFNLQLAEMIKKREEGVVVVIDIDDFKKVNDTYGHLIGDEVLKEFTSVVQKNIRSVDIFARWGGEEFLILLRGTTIENALIKIETIREKIDKHNFKIVGHLTSSFGLTAKVKNDDIHTILQRADRALYEAKEGGKNMLVFKKSENANK